MDHGDWRSEPLTCNFSW